jgi:uncharacterized membrane protein HdeD (DUF308 family)
MKPRPEPAMAGHLTGSWTRSFRVLYLSRVGLSAAWVTLVSVLASSAQPGSRPGLLAGILLACYPVSDAVATLFDLRANRAAPPRWPQQLNLVAGLAAAGGILIALLSGLAAAITAFGIWAVVSGAIMAVLAVRRRRVLRGQWLMLISGAGSVFAGITFIDWTGSPAAGLAVLAQYSAGGALWYLLAGLLLLRSVRPSTAVARSADAEDNDPRSSLNLVPRSREEVDSAFQRRPPPQISAGPCSALGSRTPRRRRLG